MKRFLLCIIPLTLFGEKLYETKLSEENVQAMHNPKIKCRMVCDKKIYRQKEIKDAISFYKNSKNYKFQTNGFESFQ